jgi:hypothetical protein
MVERIKKKRKSKALEKEQQRKERSKYSLSMQQLLIQFHCKL